jgi:hypothetical protein
MRNEVRLPEFVYVSNCPDDVSVGRSDVSNHISDGKGFIVTETPDCQGGIPTLEINDTTGIVICTRELCSV